jgi:putative CocE/NonD family hydrolase
MTKLSRPGRVAALAGAALVAGATLSPAALAVPRSHVAGAGEPAASVDQAGTGWLAAKQAALARFAPPPPATVTSAAPAQGGSGYTASTMGFDVRVGPREATSCHVVGELFLPAGASAAHPVPAILTTNGFGGSYQDQVPLAEFFAPRGFAVLAYSGLGFGGSGCQIELDLPQWDGLAASELISYLGTLPQILKDGPDDPRVGMTGGSYGGDVQFSAASIDPRLDAIIPVITWNDLAYSLGPNNDTTAPVRWDVEPGVAKIEWDTLFFADGLAQPASHPSSFTPSTCPDFDPRICQAYATSAALGYLDRATINLLRATSMVTYYRQLHLPVMLMQGEDDTLFNVEEAVDNYRELVSDGDPVKLVLQSWGHSDSTPAPGELSYTSTAHGYETLLMLDWFDRWLKQEPVSVGPTVEYFRPWVAYDTSGSAEPAYGTAPSWPVGQEVRFWLSGNGSLVADRQDVVAGTETFVNPPGGIPESYSETSAEQDSSPFTSVGPTDAPGSYASFESAPLERTLDVVGVPLVHLDLSTAVPPGLDPASDPVLFVKLYDVAPDGTMTLVHRLVSPVRVDDESGPLTVTLPGIVHQFPAGDRLDLVVAATDAAYIGSRAPDVLQVGVDPASPTALELPVVPPADQQSGGARASGA